MDSSGSEFRILITGARGFVGPYLVKALRCTLGSDVLLLPTARQAEEHSALGSVEALDVGDCNAVDNLVARWGPTHIVQLAGIASPSAARVDPQAAWRVHLHGSLNVPVDGRMAETVGMVLAPDAEIVLVAPDGQEQEAALRLARIGFDGALGYLPSPESYFLDHTDLVERASRLTPQQLSEALADPRLQVVDIRNESEVTEGSLPGAVHIPLAELSRRSCELAPDRPVVVFCAGGWRSSVGASLLRQQGFTDVSDLLGGFAGWQATHQPVSA